MSEKPAEKPHSLTFINNTLTISGVLSVVEISEKEAQFKLGGTALTVKGNGLNVVKLDREQGTVQLETQSLSQLTYRQGAFSEGGLKGLFK